jgi:phosphatidylserine decarboxylase
MLQSLLPQKAITHACVWWAQSRVPFIKNTAIWLFALCAGVNWEEAIYDDPKAYPTFNDFFARELKPGLRPIAPEPAFVAPVDGYVSEIGVIEKDKLFQAKNHTYTLSDLLAGDHAMAAKFENGAFATLYLAPKNYHHVHTPLVGRLTHMTFVPGSLFCVGDVTTADTDNLFARNERLICYVETELGTMAIIRVAALAVASVYTPWHGVVKADNIQTWRYDDKPILLERGEDIGGFLMGSTTIVLMPAGTVKWDGLTHGAPVKVGMKIGMCVKNE